MIFLEGPPQYVPRSRHRSDVANTNAGPPWWWRACIQAGRSR